MSTLIKTIKLPLYVFNEKDHKKLSCLFKDFRWIYDETSKRLPSLPKKRIRHKMDKVYYYWVKEFRKKVDLPAQVAYESVLKARESYASMLSNKVFNEISHSKQEVARFHNQCFKFIRFGDWFFLNLPIKSGHKNNRILLPVSKNGYSYMFLEQLEKEQLHHGTGELKKYGTNYCFNLTIKKQVVIHDPCTPVGIDFGLTNIAVASAYAKGKSHVKLWSGKKARYKRRFFLKKISDYQRKGMLTKVKNTKSKYRDYMKTINHQVSREIIDFSNSFYNPYLIIEDLHKFRKQNDWTFSELRIFLEYKALEQGIPIITVNPKNTSNQCNKCGYTDPKNRNGIIFKCLKCEYEVNADVNASINLSQSIYKTIQNTPKESIIM